MPKYLVLLILSLGSENALSGSAQGQVNMLEVWENGNVAFTLMPLVTTCGGQFILNFSSNGSKNMYSALLASKISGKSVSVSYSDVCGPAENYGSQYNIPRYLYPGNN